MKAVCAGKPQAVAIYYNAYRNIRTTRGELKNLIPNPQVNSAEFGLYAALSISEKLHLVKT